MEKFNFHIVEKCTIWDRCFYKVEAETREEAIEFMKKVLSDDESLIPFHVENLDHTQKAMSLEENGGDPTKELYEGGKHEGVRPIFTNQVL